MRSLFFLNRSISDLDSVFYDPAIPHILTTPDGTVEPISRGQISGASGDREKNIFLACSADHNQDWQIHPDG